MIIFWFVAFLFLLQVLILSSYKDLTSNNINLHYKKIVAILTKNFISFGVHTVITVRLIWPVLSSLPWVLDYLKCCFQLGVCWRRALAPVACQTAWNLVVGSFYSYIDDWKKTKQKQKIKAFHIPTDSRKAIQTQLVAKNWKTGE